MKRSSTAAGVRCEECGAEAGDPTCYTADDAPTGYHAARRRAAEVLEEHRRAEELEAQRVRRAERSKLTELRVELAMAKDEAKRLREALAMVANVARAAMMPAGPGEEGR